MRTLSLAWLALTCAAAPWLAATEAIQSLVVISPTPWGTITDYGAGFAFKPATNLYVSALGYLFVSYLFGTNYVALDSAVVELLDSGGAVRASATLTTNSPQQGDWSYEAIPAFFIPANSTNFIVAYDPVQYAATTNHVKYWTGPYVEAVSPDWTWFEAAPELLYLGPTDGTNIIADPSYYLIGANFQFTAVPAPPALRIVQTRTNTVVLSWPTQAVAFNLQATTNLFSWPATNVPDQPVVIDTNNVLVLPSSQRRTFFRLIQ